MCAAPVIEHPVMPAQGVGHWRAFAMVVLLTFAVLGVFAATAWSMVEIWRRSDTYAHGFLVVPTFIYLVWRRRADLNALPIRPFWPGLLAIGVIGFSWLISSLAAVLAPAQFAVIALVPVAIATSLGWRWLKVLLFPCGFLFFAVPFGEILVPKLVDWTADFTVTAVRLSGVPVYREGPDFVLPSGNWSVVDGCSGIRYLIASAFSGCLYAWLMYRSPLRRGLFILASLVVPLVANWLRAYGIVMLGHLSDNRIAAGVDHLVYGWVFFGFVIFVLFAVGARWREDQGLPMREEPPRALGQGAHGASMRTGAAAALVATALGLIAWPIARAALTPPAADPTSIALSVTPAGGWQAIDAFTSWQATMVGPAARHTRYFEKAGRRVGVQIGVYRDQAQGAELVTSGNQLVGVGADPGWRVLAQASGALNGADGVRYRDALLRADQLLAIRHWYWLGDRTATSDLAAKFDLAIDRLFRRIDASAWVIVFASAERDLDEAKTTLDEFQREMGSSIDAALQGARQCCQTTGAP